MSAAVYREPYRLPAGLLALAVHGAFFALLYFGFTWQTLPPATMSVELWHDLPDQAVAPPPAPEKIEQVVAEEPVPQPVKPEIVLPTKKKIEIKPAPVKPQPKAVVSKPVEIKPDTSAADQQAAQAAQAARERAEQAAAIGRVVDEYVARIVAKIRRNIVLPPDVANDARAEFAVTLLPGGTVLNARLLKSSGFDVYDNAVERAIIKSQPLPLPPDPAMFNRFRELKLGFKPAE